MAILMSNLLDNLQLTLGNVLRKFLVLGNFVIPKCATPNCATPNCAVPNCNHAHLYSGSIIS